MLYKDWIFSKRGWVLGDNVTIVCNDLPDNVMVAGVPAKIKKSLDFGN